MSDGAEKLQGRLRSAPDGAPEDVLCAYLFGSRARGEARAKSDVDLGVRPARHPAPTLDGEYLDLAPLRRLYRRMPA